MSGEITVQTYLKVVNANSKYEFNSGFVSLDQAAVGGPTPGYFTLGTSEETIAFAELASPGIVVVHNLDATNYIEVGFATGGPYGMKLIAGESHKFRLNGTSLFMRAHTSSCKVEVLAFEN